jgi:hypothetical protein
LPNGETVRESAGTRSWEQGERNAPKKEAEADPTRVDQMQPRRATVKDAIRMFLQDEEARGLEHSSRKKSPSLFERQLLPFCETRKYVHIDQIVPVDLTEFRSTRNNDDVTTHRKHERMHSFFAFCVANDLQRKNPMDALKKPKMPDVAPTDYFLPKDFEQVVAAASKYEYGGGNDNQHRGQRLRALTLLGIGGMPLNGRTPQTHTYSPRPPATKPRPANLPHESLFLRLTPTSVQAHRSCDSWRFSRAFSPMSRFTPSISSVFS